MENAVKVVVDRFEGDFAVCEKDDRKMMNIEKARLPVNVKESDVLVISGGNIILDANETEKRKREIDDLTDGLWK